MFKGKSSKEKDSDYIKTLLQNAILVASQHHFLNLNNIDNAANSLEDIIFG